MNKLDNKFRQEVNNNFKEIDYVSKKLGLRIAIIVLIISIIGAIGSYGYKKFAVEKDRDIFKSSVTYTESAAAFLADRYQEYSKAETPAEKTAIMQYVIMRYPNLDTDEIDNSVLRQFYNKCLIGG